MARRRTERRSVLDEPDLTEGAELDAGSAGEPMLVLDRTEAGFPIGLTLRELRESEERARPEAPWVRAKRALEMVLRGQGRDVRHIGRVVRIGGGLSRDVFGAEVEHDQDVVQYVVGLPRADADPDLGERTRREARLLELLARRSLPFRLPEVVGFAPDGRHEAVVRRFVRGVPLDLRAGRQGSVRPWEIVAEIAAALHGIVGSEVEAVTLGHPTRRAHALDALRVFEGLEPEEMRRAAEWGRRNLPPDELSVLLHGDLLGQNVLLAFDGPHFVLDWEYALRGDPAADLAIVTRAAKKPFQLAHGLALLLRAYEARGGRGVLPQHVHLYELCLVAGHYRQALAGTSGQSPEFELARMRSVLSRVQ